MSGRPGPGESEPGLRESFRCGDPVNTEIRDCHGEVRVILVEWPRGCTSAEVSRPLLMDLIRRANPGVMVVEQEEPVRGIGL